MDTCINPSTQPVATGLGTLRSGGTCDVGPATPTQLGGIDYPPGLGPGDPVGAPSPTLNVNLSRATGSTTATGSAGTVLSAHCVIDMTVLHPLPVKIVGARVAYDSGIIPGTVTDPDNPQGRGWDGQHAIEWGHVGIALLNAGLPGGHIAWDAQFVFAFPPPTGSFKLGNLNVDYLVSLDG